MKQIKAFSLALVMFLSLCATTLPHSVFAGEVHEHSYTESERTDATCAEDGYIIWACECGNTYTEILPATGHSHEATVTEPTCTGSGYTTHTCHCGNTYKDSYIAPLGHSYTDGICQRCGTDDPNATYHSIPDGVYYIAWGSHTLSALPEEFGFGYAPGGDTAALTPTDYFTITNVGDGRFTLQDCYGRYLYLSGSSNDFRASAELPSEGYLWILQETEGGLLLKNADKNKFAYYDEGYSNWSCKATPSESSVLSVTEKPDILWGDTNGDGIVNHLDAMLIAQFYVGAIGESGIVIEAADINGDGVINHLDAMLAAQLYVGAIDGFSGNKNQHFPTFLPIFRAK